MKSSLIRPLVAALLAAGSTAALAHGSFILPSSTVLSKPAYVTFDAASGNDMFYFNHNTLRGDITAIAPDGSSVPLENEATGKLRRVFDVNMKDNGTYRIRSSNSGINARWKDAEGKNKIWRGPAAEFDKNVPKDAAELRVGEGANTLETFVTVGKPSALKPSGQGLGFAPVTHPNDLYAGEDAVFRFTLDGKPVPAGLEVDVHPGGSRYRDAIGDFKLKTDAQGEVRIKWPTPGMYRIEVEMRDSKTSLPQIKERRLSYAAVLEVLPQ
ncbi:MAG: ABC transporter permease [Thiobacillus sp. 65-69]|nr:DUF4198 domain-containing protein [Thiobacillus sp.]ODU89703.1 MAG: ABC transporter permease [Thiobacillus sp. SCN 65-179]OJW37631.1 MAG: ABC transporter permease [Thiobacillus sp. 65-69]